MTDVAEAAADLRDALPEAGARLAIPDTDGTTSGRSKPGSRPPWNPAAAAALFDALEGIRRLHAALTLHVAGRDIPRRPVAVTGHTLAAIVRLAEAADDAMCREAARDLRKWAQPILQLPAVDQAERAERVEAACPYCQFPMLWLWRRAGRVACTRFGLCADGNGLLPSGLLDRSVLDGSPRIFWSDGRVT